MGLPDGPKPPSGPPVPAGALRLGGLWWHPEVPDQPHCEECGTELTGLCAFFILPTPGAPTLVKVFPVQCPECKHVLTPAPGRVMLPGRPS